MSTGAALPVVEAETTELARLADELGVADEMPGPSLTAWIADTSDAFGNWLASLLADRLGAVSELAVGLVRFGLAALLLILLAFGAIYLWRWWRRRWAPPVSPAASAPEVEPLVETPDSVETWTVELRRLLAEGDGVGAAEALWWWLANILEADAEPSWTSRELIARVGRRDLAPAVRRLDWMLYGPWSPDAGEVEGLWRDLAERSRPATTGGTA